MFAAYFTRHGAVLCLDFSPASRKRLTAHRLRIHRRATEGVALQVKWRWNNGQKNRDHRQRDDHFGDRGTETSEQTSPAGAASINHSFTGDQFTGDRAKHRAGK